MMWGFAVAGWSLSPQTLVTGAITGLAYALLASGLMLVYRATKVINFAQGQMGAFGAALLAKAVLDWSWFYAIALAAVLVVGGLVGAVVELGIVRRLFDAPRLVLLVATIGVSQLLLVAEALLPDVDASARRYPTPFDVRLDIGDVHLNGAHLFLIVVAPLAIAGLGWFLTRTWYGVAIRASADNRDRAELTGISTRRISTLVWVIAGVLSTLTAVLLNPVRGTIVGLPDQALGPGLLLRALTAALVGGLVSLRWTVIGGIAIGVIEAIMFANIANPGAVDLFLLAVVLLLVLRRRGAADDDARWALSPPVAPVPATSSWWARRLPAIGALVALAIGIALPLVFTTSARAFLFSTMLLYALVGLSVSVLTGWAGQLSLGQFAFVGLGAMLCGALHRSGMPFAVAVLYATAAGVLASLLVGFPALRVRGLFLAVTTLAFAVAARSWILTHPWLLDHRTVIFLERGELFGIDLHPQRNYYYLCLVVLVAASLAVAALRRSGIGRTIIATRENEAAAASFTISPTVAKLTAFGVAGGLAALAGALLAGLRVQYGADGFGPEQSLQIVSMTIIGGLGTVGGPILGAVYVVGLPALFGHNDTVGLATSGIGLLLLLLYLPGGLMSVVARGRALLMARFTGEPTAPAPTRDAALPVRTRPGVAGAGARGAVLEVHEVSVRFGGRVALDEVSIAAAPGEILGLIGANGAGKSTLLNVIGGYVPTTTGRVLLDGADISSLPAHARARRGIGRVFQDARLFGELTVSETIEVALEAEERSELVPSLLALSPSRRAEARKRREAAALIDYLGLGRFADRRVAELSTGTRRIVELCGLLAQGSRLLLLDEPTAGVAQRETEAFGPLIRRVGAELGATIVIIEHDMPLVMSISDRICCLGAGRVLATGDPESVRTDPAVIAAYLGTDERAIHRSGAPAVPA